MVGSFFSQVGISVNVSDPLWFQPRAYYGDYAARLTGYSHTLTSMLGFDAASFTMPLDQIDLELWFQSGLGRDVVVHNSALGVAFEGFVNSIEILAGPLRVLHGPLLGVSNKIDIVYSTIDGSADPPAIGTRERLSDYVGYTEDADSQTRYNIITRILSTGGIQGTDDAQRIVDTYLADHRLPETSQQFNSQQARTAQIKVDVLGYAHWLRTYPYNSTTTGDTNASTKIQSALAADPNSILSTDYDHIDTNTVQVAAWDNDDRLAYDVIRFLLSYGDANDRRYTFGVYEGRRAFYTVMPDAVAYHQAIDEPNTLTTPTGGIVQPWDMRPARWLFYENFLPGLEQPHTLAERRSDPRFEFVESVTYSAPFGLQHNGAKQGTLKQVLAKYGLTGVGA